MRRILPFVICVLYCSSGRSLSVQSQKDAGCKAGDTLCVSQQLQGRKARLVTITALEYHETKEKPYTIEGKTTTPPILYYKLACKRGGADIQVGRSYKATESRDENDVKVLVIYLSVSDKPDVIGVVCDVVSARTTSGQSKKVQNSKFKN